MEKGGGSGMTSGAAGLVFTWKSRAQGAPPSTESRGRLRRHRDDTATNKQKGLPGNSPSSPQCRHGSTLRARQAALTGEESSRTPAM